MSSTYPDPAPITRTYPSATPGASTAAPVPLATPWSGAISLPEGGYPDVAEAAQAYAAGQRATTRTGQSRAAGAAPAQPAGWLQPVPAGNVAQPTVVTSPPGSAG